MNRMMIERAAKEDAKEVRISANKVRSDIDVQNILQQAFMSSAQWVLDTLGKMQPTDAWKEITENKRRAHDENPNL